MIQLDDFNPFARGFAVALFAVHPEWRHLATLETWEKAEPGCLALAVTSPAHFDRQLWIGTWGGEVTVGFGQYGWHTHFGDYIGLDAEASYREALDEIEAILSDRLAIITEFQDGQARGSRTFWDDEDPPTNPVERLEIESWTGSRDATVFPA